MLCSEISADVKRYYTVCTEFLPNSRHKRYSVIVITVDALITNRNRSSKSTFNRDDLKRKFIIRYVLAFVTFMLYVNDIFTLKPKYI